MTQSPHNPLNPQNRLAALESEEPSKTGAIANPHDAFFKGMMTDLNLARKFFEIHLPKRYQAKCDLSTLALQSGSFVETNLRQHFSDVLYSMKIEHHTGYVYCLIEHLTQDHPLTAFQILRYQIAIMHQHLQKGHQHPPVVIPLLFYRGKKSPYPGSLDVFDCFQDPEFAREVLLTPLILVDLSVIPDDKLKAHQQIA